MFGHFNDKDAFKPLYDIDYEDDDELLKWIDIQYNFRAVNSDELNRIDSQSTSLALFLNLVPDNKRLFSGSPSGNLSVFQRKQCMPVVEPMLNSIVTSWVSRLGDRKPQYFVFPKESDDPAEKGKAKTIKEVLEHQAQKNNHETMSSMALQHMFVFGEAYLEVFWDPDVGPLDPVIQKDLEERGGEALEDLGDLAEGMRIGDVGSTLHDPRNVIVQPAKAYKDAEWVILMEVKPISQLRHEFPDLDKELQSKNGIQLFRDFGLDVDIAAGHTILYKLYHRANKHMPKGRVIWAVPDAVLKNEDLPCPRLIKNQRFPVLQLTDTDIWGYSRGFAGTVMESIKTALIALNKLWLSALMNIAMNPPKLAVQEKSVDSSRLRTGERNLLYYKRGYETPKLLVQEMVSQGHMLLMDKLRQRILNLANVEQIHEGVSRPNVESADMLEIFNERELEKSQPKDIKYKRFLEDWAKLIIDFVADKYEDEEERTIQYFGRLNKRVRKKLKVDDLDIDVDVHVQSSTGRAKTLEGRVRTIQSILQLAPGSLTQAEIIDQLEIGSPEKAYDSITNAIDTAEEDIVNILSGKEVPSPKRYQDLLTYYGVYRRELQKAQIRDLLPEVYEPGGKGVGNRFLDQVASIERLLMDILAEKGSQPIYSPEIETVGITFSQILFGRYPDFPAVFQPEPISPINPLEVDDEGLPFEDPEISFGSSEQQEAGPQAQQSRPTRTQPQL